MLTQSPVFYKKDLVVGFQLSPPFWEEPCLHLWQHKNTCPLVLQPDLGEEYHTPYIKSHLPIIAVAQSSVAFRWHKSDSKIQKSNSPFTSNARQRQTKTITAVAFFIVYEYCFRSSVSPAECLFNEVLHRRV